MSMPNHPLWVDTTQVPMTTMPSRGLYPPSAYPYPAYLGVPWDQVSTGSSGIAPQDMAGNISAPVPFSEVHNISEHGVVPSAPGWMNPIDASWSAQRGSALLADQRAQGIGNAATAIPRTPTGTPAQSTQNGGTDGTGPTVIRHTIGTPAMISSVNRRRVRPHKYSCHICCSMFTSKENRNRHVRAHYGIKPFICFCSVAFTAKADLSRHRKGGRCPLAGRIE